ncbi:MAG: hypothetical protein HY858_06065 [Candidatus Solibacter usitatus]|nr:hypothetical protein [Candidatus Solibacter usitatus]
MKLALLALAASAALLAQQPARTYTGVITDTMCGADHAHMGITPAGKCVRECVQSGGGRWKYALLDGRKMYVLSDQQTPEKYAARKVRVTGVLYEKTGVLKVDRIEAAE